MYASTAVNNDSTGIPQYRASKKKLTPLLFKLAAKVSGFFTHPVYEPGLKAFSYPEPFLRAVRRGALAKSITGYHKNMVIEYIRY
jgi:hypothetical protein